MILQDQLNALTEQFASQIPETARAAMKQATQELKESGILSQVIQAGDTLPPFSLTNQNGDTIHSQDLLKEGPLVLSFFRGVWCPYCNLELQALQAHAESFRAAKAKIIVISPQLPAYALKTTQDNNTSFDVLSDSENHYAKSLGLAFQLPSTIQELYENFGINLETYNGDTSWQLPMPARIIVHTDGTIRHIEANPDYTTRPDPNETLNILHAKA